MNVYLLMKRIICNPGSTSVSQSQFFDPPEGYCIVTESISRCGPISPNNLNFLSLYNYKTVLFISEDTQNQRVINYFQEKGVKTIRIGIYAQRSNLQWRTQLDELVKESLQYILDKDNYPIMISSTSTLHLCTIIGCLRRIQGWSLCYVMDEFRRFTPEQPLSMYKNYVEMFDFDIVRIPKNSPFVIEQ